MLKKETDLFIRVKNNTLMYFEHLYHHLVSISRKPKNLSALLPEYTSMAKILRVASTGSVMPLQECVFLRTHSSPGC